MKFLKTMRYMSHQRLAARIMLATGNGVSLCLYYALFLHVAIAMFVIAIEILIAANISKTLIRLVYPEYVYMS